MFRTDAVRLIQIRDGAGYFQDAIMRPRGKPQTADGHFESPLPRIVQDAQFAQLPNGNLRIVKAAGALDSPGAFDASADVRGTYTFIFATQLTIRHRRHFYVEIDAVE